MEEVRENARNAAVLFGCRLDPMRDFTRAYLDVRRPGARGARTPGWSGPLVLPAAALGGLVPLLEAGTSPLVLSVALPGEPAACCVSPTLRARVTGGQARWTGACRAGSLSGPSAACSSPRVPRCRLRGGNGGLADRSPARPPTTSGLRDGAARPEASQVSSGGGTPLGVQVRAVG